MSHRVLVFTYVWTKCLKNIDPKVRLIGHTIMATVSCWGPGSVLGGTGGEGGRWWIQTLLRDGRWSGRRHRPQLWRFKLDLRKIFFSRGWCSVGRGSPEGWGSLQPWGSARLSRIKPQITQSGFGWQRCSGQKVELRNPRTSLPATFSANVYLAES